MASPFPGMDPYLEDPAFWRDFHHRFIDCWCEAVADELPESYEARLAERVNRVQMSPEIIKLIYPDVSMSHAPANARTAPGGKGTLLLEPVTIPHEFLEDVRETRIDILHRPDRSLVAVLELLSPTNKTGDGFQEYRAKRKAILLQKVHLVELDLLVGGNRTPLSRPLPAGDYFACVSRADNRPNCEVFSWPVRDALPMIPIPLTAPDADVHIDLAKVFQATYERGRYGRSLRYGQPPLAPLSPEDARWAMALSARK
jgi:Protein of unknown function (DUF4058)